MSYARLDTNEVEAKHGFFKALTAPLGLQAFSINQIEFAPGQAGPAHEHANEGEEEVYVVIGGRGTIRIDGEERPLSPGIVVSVTPESTRQLQAGDEGLTFVAVGAPRR